MNESVLVIIGGAIVGTDARSKSGREYITVELQAVDVKGDPIRLYVPGNVNSSALALTGPRTFWIANAWSHGAQHGLISYDRDAHSGVTYCGRQARGWSTHKGERRQITCGRCRRTVAYRRSA